MHLSHQLCMGAGDRVGDEDKERIRSKILEDFAYLVRSGDLNLKAKDSQVRK